MTKTLWWVLKLALIVAAAIWLANRPGSVTIDWLGWRIEEAPVGILLLLAILCAVIAALIYRFWRFLYRSPGGIGRAMDNSRRKKGYKALSQGMAAVAAGDAGEARKFAEKADALLQEPPLTMLLSAQAAQLNGDETAAKRYFTAMLETPETKFLGLRGLVMQALRDGDYESALRHTKEAQLMRPKTPWVLTTLADLTARTGDLPAAEEALKIAAKHQAIPAPEATGKRAALLLQQAVEAEEDRRREQALELARKAHKLAPDLLAPALVLARLAEAAGRAREAQKVAEKAWHTTPHPGLAKTYLDTLSGADAMEQLKRLGKLVMGNPYKPESHLTLAEASLRANLWGEARRHLESAAAQGETVRLCRLMAELEESEHKNGDKARAWLEKAATAAPDPTWVCESCGTVADDWTPHCRACETLDSLNWRTPPRAEPLLMAPVEAEVVEEGAGDSRSNGGAQSGAGKNGEGAKKTPAETAEAKSA